MPGIDWNTYSGNNELDEQFLEIVGSNGLEQLVDFNTRKDATLDLIFTDQPGICQQVIPVMGLSKSDHQTAAEIDLDIQPIRRRASNLQDFGRTKIKDMRGYFASVKWDLTFVGDIDKWYDNFCDVYNDAVKKFVPVKSRRKLKLPWEISSEMKAWRKRKAKLWRLYNASKLNVHWKEYIRVCESERTVHVEARAKYELQLVGRLTKDCKPFFKYARNTMKSREAVSMVKTEDGVVLEKLEDAADAINTFFASVGKEEDMTVPIETSELTWANEEINEVRISEEEVALALRNLKASKSSGPDDVHPGLLKKCAAQLAYPIFRIFDKSINDRVIPGKWKIANIVPLRKEPRSIKVCDHRPISLTSVVSKVLERIIWKRIMKFMHDTKWFTKIQFGKEHSCQPATIS